MKILKAALLLIVKSIVIYIAYLLLFVPLSLLLSALGIIPGIVLLMVFAVAFAFLRVFYDDIKKRLRFHPCPYRVEEYADHAPYCNCPDERTQRCLDEVEQ